MARKPIPQSAVTITSKDKVPISADIDYAGSHPCWRISNFDKDPKLKDSFIDFVYNTICDNNLNDSIIL